MVHYYLSCKVSRENVLTAELRNAQRAVVAVRQALAVLSRGAPELFNDPGAYAGTWGTFHWTRIVKAYFIEKCLCNSYLRYRKWLLFCSKVRRLQVIPEQWFSECYFYITINTLYFSDNFVEWVSSKLINVLNEPLLSKQTQGFVFIKILNFCYEMQSNIALFIGLQPALGALGAGTGEAERALVSLSSALECRMARAYFVNAARAACDAGLQVGL